MAPQAPGACATYQGGPGHCVYKDGDPSVPACYYCGGTDFCEDHAEATVTCRRCATVCQSHMFVDVGYYIKADEVTGQTNQLHGAPINPLLPASSMSSLMGQGGCCSRFMRNLHQQASMPSRERSLYHKFKEITEVLQQKLHIESGSVSSFAQRIWKDLKDKGVVTKGERNTAMLACCIYYACKMAKFKRTRQEIIDAFDFGQNGPRKFKQASTILLSELRDAPYYQDLLSDNLNPDDYVVRMVNSLRFQGPEGWAMVKEVRRVNTIVEESEKLANLQATTVLASIIFVVAHKMRAGEPLSLDQVYTALVVVT
jgi:transcription initiation factor TFIIIB Brf1 subunit/transcription initiation factor TFIIB